MTDKELYAAVVAQIQLGIAMARAAGVVCGPPYNIRVIRPSAPSPTSTAEA